MTNKIVFLNCYKSVWLENLKIDKIRIMNIVTLSLFIWSDANFYHSKIFGATGLCCSYFVGLKKAESFVNLCSKECPAFNWLILTFLLKASWFLCTKVFFLVFHNNKERRNSAFIKKYNKKYCLFYYYCNTFCCLFILFYFLMQLFQLYFYAYSPNLNRKDNCVALWVKASKKLSTI